MKRQISDLHEAGLKQQNPESAVLASNPSEEERLAVFNAHSMTTKSSVIEHVRDQIGRTLTEMTDASGERLRYLSARKKYLEEFCRTVSGTILFNDLEPWWSYEYTISSRSIMLRLVHIDRNFFLVPYCEALCIPDSGFTVVEVRARSLTIEEYAADRGINAGAVRQSLRRGKIRTAYKMGQEWRIPEMAQVETKRGYTTAAYQWSEELVGVPDGFEYLRRPTGIQIVQDSQDRTKYQILVLSEISTSDKSAYHTVTQKEMERLEPFLIANPYVLYRDDEKVYREKVRQKYDNQ